MAEQRPNLMLALPADLEREYWESWRTTRLLSFTDAASCLLATILALRAIQHLPAPGGGGGGRSIADTHFGPPGCPLFNLAVLAALYLASGALPLLAMALRPALYRRHRFALALFNRLLRLVISSAQLASPSAMTQVAHAIARRTTGELLGKPGKALMVSTFHPAGFWMQQANFILPWRLAVPLQLINCGLALAFWAARLPCWLPMQASAAAAAAGPLGAAAEGAPFFQEQADALCGGLQAVFAVARLAAGDVLPLTPGACGGPASVQTLVVWALVMCLVVIPLTLLLVLERSFKLGFLAARAGARGAAAGSGGTSSGSTASGSSIFRSGSSSFRSGDSSFRSGGSSFSSGGSGSISSISGNSSSGSSVWSAPFDGQAGGSFFGVEPATPAASDSSLLWVLASHTLLVFLLALAAWVFAEVFVTDWGRSVDCDALAASVAAELTAAA